MKPPTLQQVKDYIRLNGFHDVNPEKFYHYYESIGWTVGKACKPMKRWRSAVVMWTKTTEYTRKLYLMGKCECGCGNRPKIIIDGKGYWHESCLERVKKRMNAPLIVIDTRGIFKEVKNVLRKPKKDKENWQVLKELRESNN